MELTDQEVKDLYDFLLHRAGYISVEHDEAIHKLWARLRPEMSRILEMERRTYTADTN